MPFILEHAFYLNSNFFKEKPTEIKEFRGAKNSKRIFERLADPPGFEPGTFGLEVRRPIQLGYGPYIYS